MIFFFTVEIIKMIWNILDVINKTLKKDINNN